jgi:hypothetical protein
MTRTQKERRIQSLIRQFAPILQLEHWRIGVEFYGTRAEMRAANPEENFGAGCHAEPEYQQATLAFCMDEWEPDSLPEVVLHEMLHIPTWEMLAPMERWAGTDPERKETARMAVERTVCHLTRVMGALLKLEVRGIYPLRSCAK